MRAAWGKSSKWQDKIPDNKVLQIAKLSSVHSTAHPTYF